MSIIQQHTSASLSDAWRTINIDALQEDSSLNFDTSTLHPPLPEVSEPEVRQLSGQVRQLLRGGDSEGALRGCLEMPVYNGSDMVKVWAGDRAGGPDEACAIDGEQKRLTLVGISRTHIYRLSSRFCNPSRPAR